ncbi:MAG: DUF6279 family lipoprotein [Proteobacteria bacterium]|nr:DUF6279 family lipoprotein [Pseudomonadota bacterium]
MIRRIALLALLGLLGGCSALEFAYNNADTWLRWQGAHYLDLQDDQAKAYGERVDAFLGWHRARALPRYARLADEASARIARGVSRDDLLWGYDSIRAQARESLRRAGAEAADLLDGLALAQLEHLERRIAESNRKFAREHLEGSSEQLRARRLARTLQTVEEWLGNLDEAQRERVRQFSDRAPLNGELRDRERRRQQAELLAMLRAREAGARLADWAAHWDRGREAHFAEANRAFVAEYFDLLVDLNRTLSPGQRQHAIARLRGYARGFDLLAAAR